MQEQNQPQRAEYLRNSYVSENRRFEAVSILWGPDSKTRRHDHGVSTGIIRVRKGRLYEWIFDPKDGSLIAIKIHRAGDTFCEYPETMHIVGNASAEIAESDHLYSPPPCMKTYPDDYSGDEGEA